VDNALTVTLKDGANYALLVAITGAVVGGGAGWIGMLSEDGVENIAPVEVKIFYLLTLAVPLAVGVIGHMDRDANPERYQTKSNAFIISVLMGVLGAIFACGLFFIISVNVPSILGGEDPVQMNYALRERIWPAPVFTVLGVSLLASVTIGFWLGAGGQKD
jgi:hypothetical protein